MVRAHHAIWGAYGFWLLDQLKFMARYKAVLYHAYGTTILIFLAVLSVNLFGAALAIGRRFFLTFWLIRRIGAIRTAYGDFIIPGVTLVLSYLLLGESLTPAKIGGFALVMVGCALIGN